MSSNKANSLISLPHILEEKRAKNIEEKVAQILFEELNKHTAARFLGIAVFNSKESSPELKTLASNKKLTRISTKIFNETLDLVSATETIASRLIAEKDILIVDRQDKNLAIRFWGNKNEINNTLDEVILLHVFGFGERYGVIAVSLSGHTKKAEVLSLIELIAILAEMVTKYYYILRDVGSTFEGVELKAVELERQKEEFLSMVAHELRAPTSAMKGFLSMVIQGDVGDIPDKARGFLVDTAAENERLIRLVNNMLNVSRIEEGRMAYQIEIESLSRVARSVYSQFLPEAERKGLTFSLNIPSDLEDNVQVDSDRVYEAISNYVSNAVKYTIKGAIEINLSNPGGGKVKLEVKDTGPGISREEQENLFKKFYRAESNVGKTTGTGLGLYITKLLIKKFGGKVGLISKSDEGSIFWFELPLKDRS